MMCLGFLKPSLVAMRTRIGKPYFGGKICPSYLKVSCVCGCSATTPPSPRRSLRVSGGVFSFFAPLEKIFFFASNKNPPLGKRPCLNPWVAGHPAPLTSHPPRVAAPEVFFYFLR